MSSGARSFVRESNGAAGSTAGSSSPRARITATSGGSSASRLAVTSGPAGLRSAMRRMPCTKGFASAGAFAATRVDARAAAIATSHPCAGFDPEGASITRASASGLRSSAAGRNGVAPRHASSSNAATDFGSSIHATSAETACEASSAERAARRSSVGASPLRTVAIAARVMASPRSLRFAARAAFASWTSSLTHTAPPCASASATSAAAARSTLTLRLRSLARAAAWQVEALRRKRPPCSKTAAATAS
ncbi:MAG: hypothetical protein U0326_15025 [Polyangiales bacterium]